MPVIINELEVIAAPAKPTNINTEGPNSVKPIGPSPQDVYWAMRKLSERRIRLEAR